MHFQENDLAIRDQCCGQMDMSKTLEIMDNEECSENGEFLRDQEYWEDGGLRGRKHCQDCYRPCEVCWCKHLPSPPIQCRTKVIVLQHPRETRRAIRTCRMLELGLRPGSCLVFEGTSFSCENSPVSSLINQPNTFLLYPGKEAICLDNLCCMKDGQESAGEAMTLVLLDGSWREAKAILRNSPLLQTLPRLTLKDGEPSEYVVRSQPALGGLSTLEAAARAIEALEQQPGLVDSLLAPLRALCNTQIHHGEVQQQPSLFKEENAAYVKKKPQYPEKRM